jgi:hypothetical protein
MKRKQVVAKETTYETGQCLALAARGRQLRACAFPWVSGGKR